MIDIVSATRRTSKDFWSRSALGISLKRVMAKDPRIKAHIAFCNRKGLPEVYNARIDAADSQDALVFVHDDVWINDDDFGDRVLEGLRHFDVFGVAGNRRRLPYQASWCFVDIMLNPDPRENLSGGITHGERPPGRQVTFGEFGLPVELIDGVFMAARKSALQSQGVTFDTRFKFHFYDMDFSRTVRLKGLSMGTWLVNLTHQSRGAFGSPTWTEQYRAYLEKWEI
ncbi:MAG: glycosyltransferase [Aquabacterium sp.]